MQQITFMFDTVQQIAYDAQMEIVLFFLAIFAHVLIFGKHSFRPTIASKERRLSSPPVRPRSQLDRHTSSLVESKRGPDAETPSRKFSASQACPDHIDAFVDVCVGAGDLGSAERVLNQAIKSGNVHANSFNVLVRGHMDNFDVASARKVIGQMRAAGVAATPSTLWELLSPLRNNSNATASDIERTLSIVIEFERVIDDASLPLIIDASLRIGNSDIVRRLLRRQQSNEPILLKSAHAFGSVIRAYGYVGEGQGVWKTWDDMRAAKVPVTSVCIGCTVEALCSCGDADGGYVFLRQLMDDAQMRPLVNAVIYCSLLKAFSHAQRFDRMWAVYSEMLVEGMKLTIITYNTLVDSCARNREMHRIPKLLEDMIAEGIEPNVITHCAIIKGYCQERRLDRAFALLEEMKRGKVAPDEHTYNTLLNGCACQGLYERGVSLLNEMQAAGVVPTNFTLSVLAKLCGRARRSSEAYGMCRRIADQYRFKMNVHVYNNLINACTLQRDLPAGVDMLGHMAEERTRPDVRTYTLLLRGCIACRKVVDAAAFLRVAFGVPVTISSLASSSVVLLRVRDGLPAGLVTEILDGIAAEDKHLAASVSKDLANEPSLRGKLRFA